MMKYHIPGTIRVYPGIAEELLASRTYMVQAGLFRELDVMLSTHIGAEFATSYGPGGSGLVSTQYSFHGQSAHAAGSPWKGRSALDAVELMDIGWNFRREHLRPEHRSHYVITHGGDQPNVVPPEATVWYFFREWDYEKIRDLHAIGTKIANAAAKMTDTDMTERVLAATWPGYFNKPVAEALTPISKRSGCRTGRSGPGAGPRGANRNESQDGRAEDRSLAGESGGQSRKRRAPTILPKFPGTCRPWCCASPATSPAWSAITGRAVSPWRRPSLTKAHGRRQSSCDDGA